MPRLHVNIDHIATLRQARREWFPDPVAWALEAEKAGAAGITFHLRKDRRHIQDDDVKRLKKAVTTRLNFETSLDREILEIVRRTRPHAVCIVPEDRNEVTTEGGLDVVAERRRLAQVIPALDSLSAEVSLFVDADLRQIRAAAEAGAMFVELHTGRYANAVGARKRRELARLRTAAVFAHEHGLRVNAGHGLDYLNVSAVAALPHVEELNIGFAIVARALEVGGHRAVAEMAALVRKSSKQAQVRR
ncbi:MAG: pyridoxine 5'-phosphate synthase [Planctomycetota bacterium]